MNEPNTPEDLVAVMNALVYDDKATMPELPATTAEIELGMVATSFKWSPDMAAQVRKAAADKCITPSMLIRQYLAMGLAAEQPQQMIPLSDAIRVLSSLKRSA